MIKKIDNILIIKHGSLGDIIQADGIIRAIKATHSESHIALLTTSNYYRLMRRSPYIDEVLIDDRRPLWNLRAIYLLYNKVRSYKFSAVYDLQNSQRTSLYKRYLISNAKWITTERKHHPVSGLRGLSEMLQSAGIEKKYLLKPNIFWLANNVTNLLKKKKIKQNYILLLPGSSINHKEKRWPYYSELARLLLNDKYNVVSVLGPEELSLVNEIPGHILTNLNWENLAGIIKKASFIVGNDSGPSHIASCLNKKGIALFGPKTSAVRSELKRGNFNTIKVENLFELDAKKIQSIILKRTSFRVKKLA